MGLIPLATPNHTISPVTHWHSYSSAWPFPADFCLLSGVYILPFIWRIPGSCCCFPFYYELCHISRNCTKHMYLKEALTNHPFHASRNTTSPLTLFLLFFVALSFVYMLLSNSMSLLVPSVVCLVLHNIGLMSFIRWTQFICSPDTALYDQTTVHEFYHGWGQVGYWEDNYYQQPWREHSWTFRLKSRCACVWECLLRPGPMNAMYLHGM